MMRMALILLAAYFLGSLPWSLWLSFGDAGQKPLLDLLRFLVPWSTRTAPGN